MKRRSKIIRKGDRARRSEASKPKRGPTPNKPSRSTSSDAGEQREIARLAHELNERSVEVGLRAAIGWLFSGGNTSGRISPFAPGAGRRKRCTLFRGYLFQAQLQLSRLDRGLGSSGT